MNNINLIGRLVADPELKYTQSGKAVVKFTIAVNRLKKDEADFIPCEAWEKQAESIAEYCRKGDRIGISGMLRIEKYEQEGQKKTFAKTIVNHADFISEKKNNSSQGAKENSETANNQDEEFPF